MIDAPQQLGDVVARDYPRMKRLAWRYLRNEADAEDAVQDAVLRAWEKIEQFEGRASLSTWLHSILVNTLRMRLRPSLEKRAPHVEIDAEILRGMSLSPEQAVLELEDQAALRSAIERLSPILRETARLVLADHSIREMCDLLDASQGTVKARRTRVTSTLRRTLIQTISAPAPAYAREATI